MERDVNHLLALTVGPVQEFIAAARRTRDLWFGSFLLSEISKAVARAVRDAKCQLIFPHPDADLAPGPTMNVANVILAEIPAGSEKPEPEVVAKGAERAAQQCWRSFADKVYDDNAVAAVLRETNWGEQVGDVVEFYAAWAPLGDDYAAARRRVMRLLGGRKNCRGFLPAEQHPGLPKSSLDGLRDTVLRGPRPDEHPLTYRNAWPLETRRRLRVRAGEQLDVVGVVKRAWQPADGGSYPSVSRVAADPWIRGIVHKGGAALLRDLTLACDRAPRAVLHRLNVDKYPQLKDFPHEGTVLFRSRHHEWFEETDDVPPRPNERRDPPAWYAEIDRALRRVEQFAQEHRLGREPNPYLAVLVADGDQMGASLAKLAEVREHQEISATLARFAEQADEIVRRYSGVPVYAGGDDVLAFLPVDQCLDCARDLHDAFGELLYGWGERAGTRITLSVGVAIGHFLEDLEELRANGQAAEKHAKKADADGVKNALAVHLHKRGGSPIEVRSRWTETKPPPARWADAPDTRLRKLAELLHAGSLPSRLAADLKQMTEVYAGWPVDEAEARQRLNDAVRHDVLRVVEAKRPRSGGSVRERLQSVLERVTDADGLRRLARELLIAQQLAAAYRQAAASESEEGR